MSFLGVSFNAGEKVGRGRITSGNTAPGPSDHPGSNVDVVAMDDFLYGEPQSLQAGAAGCAGDATTLCLNNGRFRVQAAFRAPSLPPPAPPSPTSQASATGIAADSGAFSFRRRTSSFSSRSSTPPFAGSAFIGSASPRNTR
jgi:hypothetical protein